MAGYRVKGSLDYPAGSYVAYEASKGSGGGRVVLKLVTHRLSRDKRFSDNLEGSLPGQSALEHPAMARVYEGGRAEQGLYVVTALVRRPTLAEVLEADSGPDSGPGRIGPSRALRVLVQVADVLTAAHAIGLVHGFLKPHSIRLGPRDEVFVDDFALSPLEADQDHYAGPALLHGAPEQVAGRPATARSDVYGLAAVAYECLTGALPYWHGPLSHDGKPPLPMARHSSELPPELDVPLARALSEEPDERHASVSAFVEELAGAVARRTRRPAKPVRASVSELGTGSVRAPRMVPAGAGAAPRAPHLVPAGAGAAPRAPRVVPAGTGANGRRFAVNRRGLVAGIAALLVTAAAAIVALGRDRAQTPRAVATTVKSGFLELTAPPGWGRPASPSDFAGLSFAQTPVTLAPPGRSPGLTLVAGWVTAEKPTYLPQSVSASLAGELSRPDVVTLRGRRALRYSGLRPRGSRSLVTLYSIPTSAGTAIITCSVPDKSSSPASELSRCERVVATLRLRGPQPRELIVSGQYGELITSVLTRLNTARARQRARLRQRGRQPAAARSLALAYADAGRALAAADPPENTELHKSIRRAFRRTRQAYAQLATAARRNDRPGYRRARRAVGDGEQAIQASLRSLNTLGYTAR